MDKDKATKIVEQLKQDLGIYLEDALEASGETEEDNEWLAQIKAIADAAYGEGNY